MRLRFSKMHGAGNDFIVAAHDYESQPVAEEAIQQICHRQRGVGADGLILVKALSATNQADADFRMFFFNCDGSRAEMCGNGLRCAALYCGTHLTDRKAFSFLTDAGVLPTEITGVEQVRIELPVLSGPEVIDLDGEGQVYYCNTGVPHVIVKVTDIDNVAISERGRLIRYHSRFEPAGTNVNFVETCTRQGSPFVRIRTYERGVEAETRACGTGIGAAAVCLHRFDGFSAPIRFITRDNDELTIEFLLKHNMVNGLSLTGPAVTVFESEIDLDV